jgi:hypothetical protein
MEYREKPDRNQGLFQQYITIVLILFINKLRANEQFAEKPAMLLIDNCFIQTKPEVLPILRED